MIDTYLSCAVRVAKSFERIADALEEIAVQGRGEVVHKIEIASQEVKPSEQVVLVQGLTEADVRKAIATHVNKHGVDGTRAILKKFGDGMVASIPTEKYADVIKALGE